MYVAKYTAPPAAPAITAGDDATAIDTSRPRRGPANQASQQISSWWQNNRMVLSEDFSMDALAHCTTRRSPKEVLDALAASTLWLLALPQTP